VATFHRRTEGQIYRVGPHTDLTVRTVGCPACRGSTKWITRAPDTTRMGSYRHRSTPRASSNTRIAGRRSRRPGAAWYGSPRLIADLRDLGGSGARRRWPTRCAARVWWRAPRHRRRNGLNQAGQETAPKFPGEKKPGQARLFTALRPNRKNGSGQMTEIPPLSPAELGIWRRWIDPL